MAGKGSSGVTPSAGQAATTLIALAGVVAAVLTLPQYRLLLLAIAVIALAPPLLCFLSSRIQKWPHWQRLAPWLACLVIVATGGALIVALQHPPSKLETSQPIKIEIGQPPPQAHEDSTAPIQFIRPSNLYNAGECLKLLISGHVPSGEELVIAVQPDNNNQRYFLPASPGINGNSWSITVTLGSQQMPTGVKSQNFTIYAALMADWLAQYLATMQQYQDPGDSYWVSSKWPPSALQTDEFTVTRTQPKGPSACLA